MKVLSIAVYPILLISLFLLDASAVAQTKNAGRAGEEGDEVEQSDQEGSLAPPAGSSEAKESPNTLTEKGEEEIDLEQLDDAETPAHPPGHPGSRAADTRIIPFRFKLFFDLLLEYEFETETFQFTRDHAYVVLELTATDWLSFRTDVSPEPQFFEIVFNFGQTAELRLGKVLVPFGQNEFHHLIGGRVDKQNLFLPTIWADYGLAFKHLVYDGDLLSFDYSAWVINGFQETSSELGAVPFVRAGGPLGDNNKMKGVGVRPALHIGSALTIGTSWYLDIWNEYEKELEAEELPVDEQFMLIYGADIDFGYGLIPLPVLRDLRLRGEIAWAEVMLPGRNVRTGVLFYYASLREGFNIELSFRVVQWLVLRYRFGYLDPDDLVDDVQDLIIHEPAIIATFGPVQFSLVLQIHDSVYDLGPDAPAPVDDSCLFGRVLFRY
ncbi:MAG: hypothetical protein JXA30_18960 [Deltaproteobacteria bacterium]|nr:hypothetical protein [Deltaproteobacteria bacterium]